MVLGRMLKTACFSYLVARARDLPALYRLSCCDVHDNRYFSLYSCLFLSFLRASLCRFTLLFFCNTGNCPFTARLNNNSAGGTRVEQCGEARYWRGNRFSSCLHGRCSILAVLSALLSGCIKRSASALPLGHRGMDNSSFIPNVFT